MGFSKKNKGNEKTLNKQVSSHKQKIVIPIDWKINASKPARFGSGGFNGKIN